MHLRFVTDERGKKTAVQIPLREWDVLQRELKKLELLGELEQAFSEMHEYRSGKLATLTTEELLSQL
jgi:hypothetical protein